MRAFLIVLISLALAAPVATASDHRVTAAPGLAVLTAPAVGAPPIGFLPQNAEIIVREKAEAGFVRIDGAGVFGPAFVPAAGLAATSPGRAGSTFGVEYYGPCPCPGSLSAEGNRCGDGASFCQPGGKSPTCLGASLARDCPKWAKAP